MLKKKLFYFSLKLFRLRIIFFMQILENYFIFSFKPLRLRKIIFFTFKHWRILLIQLHSTFANTISAIQFWIFFEIWKTLKLFFEFCLKFFLNFFENLFTLLLCRCATPDYFQCQLSRIIKVIIVISMIWSCTRKNYYFVYTPLYPSSGIQYYPEQLNRTVK